MAQLYFWTKIRTKQSLVLSASAFQCMPQMLQFCLFTYPSRSKWASSEKMFFFFAKIGIFCKAQTLRSVIHGYRQPYSFGGWIKLIICQIWHELSINIHEISTSWKKTLDGGLYIKRRQTLWKKDFKYIFYTFFSVFFCKLFLWELIRFPLKQNLRVQRPLNSYLVRFSFAIDFVGKGLNV